MPFLTRASGSLSLVGKVLEQRVPGLDRLGVHLLAVEALADPVLRVVGEVGAGVGAQVLGEALHREVVVAARVVGVGLAVELARRGRRRRRRDGRAPAAGAAAPAVGPGGAAGGRRVRVDERCSPGAEGGLDRLQRLGQLRDALRQLLEARRERLVVWRWSAAPLRRSAFCSATSSESRFSSARVRRPSAGSRRAGSASAATWIASRSMSLLAAKSERASAAQERQYERRDRDGSRVKLRREIKDRQRPTSSHRNTRASARADAARH